MMEICQSKSKVEDRSNKSQSANIPEVIEEFHKDSDGKICSIKYLRGKLLGKGGFAKCFQASHLPSQTQYALKIVSKSTLAKSRARQKLQTEISIHRRMRHLNVVKFERYFEDVENSYILLELCSNNSMSELLKRRRRVAEIEVRCYISQLVSSLKYLHSQLVIHRDLKLGNLFLDCELRLKVGDFGLAAKLSHPTEKRRTICGTPNYIAPEILEGKDGHSFEVDIWSAGVVMYTLLIGTPPFESKDVKSTYKRILNNSFSFPDHIMVSDDAKSLIRMILQSKAENRPTLDEILQHNFFTRSNVVIPNKLPECALFETPQKQQILSLNSEIQKPLSGESKLGVDRMLTFGDENDPTVINRGIPIATTSIAIQNKASIPAHNQKQISYMSNNIPERKTLGPLENNFVRRSLTPSNAIPSVKPGTLEQRLLSQGTTNLPDFVPQTGTAPMRSRDYVSKTSSLSTVRSSQTKHNDNLVPPNKFDIYTEKKKEVTSSSKPTVLQNVIFDRSVKSPLTRHQPVRPLIQYDDKHVARKRASTGSGVGHIEQVLENVHIHSEDKEGSKKIVEKTPILRTKIAKHDSHDKRQSLIVSSNHASLQTEQSSSNHTKRKSSEDDEDVSPGHPKSKSPKGSFHDKYVTPAEVMEKRKVVKTPGTLEALHEMLNINFPDAVDDAVLESNAIAFPSSKQVTVNEPNLLASLGANIWVVRYVDFTSKYGLGFLLNTGGSGVYFNDSTKIILSSSGEIFQYMERKRIEGSPSELATEQSIQTHYIHLYPIELQKKVTLLCHFKNYLLDQTKLNGSHCADGQGDDMDEHMKMKIPAEIHSVTAASTKIRFGASSAVYIPSKHDNPKSIHDRSPSTISSKSEILLSPGSFDEMIYLKKWVRTKHAILFRLSNKTVQVVFFDRSEILLSCRGVTTYVNKQGERSDHMIQTVVQSGRKDIAKRLKYTKDIMLRLINIQQPK